MGIWIFVAVLVCAAFWLLAHADRRRKERRAEHDAKVRRRWEQYNRGRGEQ